MPMYSPNRAAPSIPAGQDGPARGDRGMTDYFDMRRQPNKARVNDSRLIMMRNAGGQHARRAPKVDILR